MSAAPKNLRLAMNHWNSHSHKPPLGESVTPPEDSQILEWSFRDDAWQTFISSAAQHTYSQSSNSSSTSGEIQLCVFTDWGQNNLSGDVQHWKALAEASIHRLYQIMIWKTNTVFNKRHIFIWICLRARISLPWSAAPARHSAQSCSASPS